MIFSDSIVADSYYDRGKSRI